MCRKLIYLWSFALALAVAVTGTVNADPSLVGWWRFDEGSGATAYDSSGNENHGSVAGVQWVAGKMGGALEFDGSSSIGVEIPFSESLRLLNQGDLTLTAWFKADEVPSANTIVFQQADLNGTGRTWLYYRASDDSIATYLGGGPTLAGVSMTAGTWYHAAVVVTEAGATDTIQVYVNGEPAGTPGRMGMEDCEGNYFIGRHKSVRNVWDGIIDDVQMYSRALTKAEIVQVMLGRDPRLASNPSPANQATDVPRDVVLTWTPGEFAPPVNGHKVYLSENFNDVNDGIGGIAQDPNSYAPAQRLDFGTTYYWRVDEVNGPPDYTVYEGSVWSFTTEPIGYPIENIIATASSTHQADMGPENTINGSGLDDNDLHSMEETDMWLSSATGPQPTWIEYEFDKVYKLHQMFVWNSNQMVEPLVGFGFKDVAIEYSVNGTDYTTLGTTHEFARAPGAAGYAYNTTIDFGSASVKYVKLTAASNWGRIVPQYGLSEVRFLHIPVSARKPYPDAGATGVNVDVVLGWHVGREASTHNVYFGADEQAVIDGTAEVTTVTEASYGLLSLDLGQTYYWRVDEVNEAQTPAVWQGDLWNFTTQQYFVVDDFESYNDLDPEDPKSNRIFLTWVDGWQVPTNGSIVGYENPPFCEQTIVHGGGQSMPFFYANTGGAAYSEAELPLSPPQDWTKHGVSALSLWFFGDASNTAAQMYVKVNGSKVTYDGDASNLTQAAWQAWNIDLASLGAGLQNVTKLAIGIDGNGASGTLYFDDIRLYRLAPEPQAN